VRTSGFAIIPAGQDFSEPAIGQMGKPSVIAQR
jgi:hypothetical protein